MAVPYRAISFCGCGFLGVYHMGVAQTFLRHGANAMKYVNKFAGSSAGSIVATIMAVCPENMEMFKVQYYALANAARQQRFGVMTPGFDVMHRLKDSVAAAMPADAHERATNRVFISVTRASSQRNLVVSQFSSVDELVQTIICSCFIPGVGGFNLPRLSDGKVYLDGGFSDNLPDFNDPLTILVSPFLVSPKWKERHVSPRAPTDGRPFKFKNLNLQLNWANVRHASQMLASLSRPVMESYELSGREVAHQFLRCHGEDAE